MPFLALKHCRLKGREYTQYSIIPQEAVEPSVINTLVSAGIIGTIDTQEMVDEKPKRRNKKE